MERAKILFVDDEERIVRLLAMRFRRDYDLYTATSGATALKIVLEHRPHVIVSDQRMPKMTGIEFLSAARKITPNSVRILLTGYSDLVTIIGAVNEGEVYRFLNKPWKEEELTDAIDQAVRIATRAPPAPQEGESLDETWSDVMPLANAAKLLAIDGVEGERHEAMELFTEDYNVLTARDLNEAMAMIAVNNVGVVLAEFQSSDEGSLEKLTELRRTFPATTIVMLAQTADSPTIIRLINDVNVYRFAMRPIAPNVFRLAVSAAMREHHRRLAMQYSQTKPDAPGLAASSPVLAERSLADGIVESIGRFTKLW